MIIQRGEKYKFKYLPIQIYTDIDSVESVKKEIHLSVFVPNDFTEWSPDGFVLIEILYEGESKELYSGKSPIILYFDEIKEKGKYKWEILNKEECNYKVQDLPAIIDSSLNTYDHPSKRRWFLFEHCGLTDKHYQYVNWQQWKNYERKVQYSDITLYYRIMCDLVYNELSKDNSTHSYEDWKEIISFNYKNNNFYKLSNELLEECHSNYLRDILKLW